MHGNTMKTPTVNAIAAFAHRAGQDGLTSSAKHLYKRNILDSLGCAIAAISGSPFAALREQFEEDGGRGRCTLIGGGHATVGEAALFNSGLVRYVDLLDSYMSPGGLCHPSDNFGGLLAAADHAEASGADFMLALAVAYEIQCRFTAVVPVMAKGFNHAIQLAMSLAAGTGRLYGLTEAQIAHAISIATVDNISLTVVHAEPVSQWKGFSPGITAMRAVLAASLAKRGFTGPSGLFEGPNGLIRMFDQEIPVDWSDDSMTIIEKTVMKKYCSLIHGQPVLEAVLALKRANKIKADDIASVRCDIFETGYVIAGGGAFGPKDSPQTKEQADYNLKYLIAAALLDDQVGPPQLEQERVRADDAQALLKRVTVCEDPAFTKQYPDRLNTRIVITTNDNRSFTKEQQGYEGGLNSPLTWERTVEKFHWLAEPYADGALRANIIGAVDELEAIQIRDLMSLLADVKRRPTYPTVSRGIQ